MPVYSRFIRGVRFLARPFVYLRQRTDLSEVPDPCVFIGRHRNLRGPIFSVVDMPREMHVWVYSVFCEKQSCLDQYANYTFSVRMKWPALLVRVASYLLSRLVPWILKSLGGIPVYRQSMRIKETMRLTVDALARGESVVIFPDVDYVNTDDAPGALYTGFLMLGRLYHGATGRNLNFVPMDLDMRQRRMLIGNPIEFDGAAAFHEERRRAGEAIHKELTRLGELVRSSAEPL